MRCCHLNEREYRDLVMNSLWYSPVQDQSSGNASLLQWGEGFLILNYIIDGCAAIISLSLLSGLADFSSNWEGRLIAFSLKRRSSPSLLYISSTSKMLSYLTARFTSLKSSGDCRGESGALTANAMISIYSAARWRRRFHSAFQM